MESFRLPSDLANFLLKQLTLNLKRSSSTATQVLNTLSHIANDNNLFYNAALVLVDRLKVLNVPYATVTAALENVKDLYPDYMKFITDLYNDSIPFASVLSRTMANGSRNGGNGSENPLAPGSKSFLASLKSLSIFAPSSPSPSSLQSTASSPPSSSSAAHNGAANTSASKKSSIVLPYLLERCSALFWTRVVTKEAKRYVPALETLKAALEPLPVSDPLVKQTALFRPNFVLILDAHEIKVHDWILYARWPWFRSLMNSGMEETLSKRATLPPNTFSYPGLIAFIYYLYAHQTDLYTPTLATELLFNAEMFQLAELFTVPLKPHPAFDLLIRHCNTMLIHDLNVGNCIEKLKIAKEHGVKAAISNISHFIASNIIQIGNHTEVYAKLMELDAQIVKDIMARIRWSDMEQKNI